MILRKEPCIRMFIEKKISSKTIKEIKDVLHELITNNDFKDASKKTATRHGFQTPNIVNLFSKKLLKKILPIENYYTDINYIHYIYYFPGGWQDEHLHKDEQYSFILYLNDSDGPTFFKEPINKKITPQKGKLIFFGAQILHGCEKSFKNKQILVGAVNKHV